MHPLDYSIDSEKRLITVRCSGAVTLAEILDYERRIVEDPDFDPSYSELFDTTEVTSMRVSLEDVDHIVQSERVLERYSGERKCAFVAPSDLFFGTARMYATMAEDTPMETRVFRSLDEAWTWLGMAPAE